jgi:putative membrane protein
MKCASIWSVVFAAALTFGCADRDRPADDTAATPGATSPATGTPGADTARDRPMAGPSDADQRQFVENMAVVNMAEVRLGNLAAERAANAEVKQFARRMVADHTKASEELKPIASQLNVQVPSQLDAEHQALHDRLSKLKGQEFDREYIQAMMDGHQQVANEVEKHANEARSVGTAGEAGQAGNRPVAQWASKTLPTVREHLDQAKEIQSKLGSR